MESRSYWIDYAKAIGIVLVVYGHVARGIYKAGIEIPNDFYMLADSIIYSFHMPLFFFLSGVLFYSSFIKKGGVKFVSGKIDTIVYPYIVWSILQGIIEFSLSNYTNGSVSLASVFSFFWLPRAQFWFLYALFVIFVLATTIFSFSPKNSSAIVFLASVFFYIQRTVIPGGFIGGFISQYFVFFMFGIVFSLHFNEKFFSKAQVVLCLACLFVVSQYVFHITFNLNYQDKGIASLLLALCSILFVVSVSSWAALKPNHRIVYIGTSSMAIYLMHVLAGSGIRIVLKAFSHIDFYVAHLILGFAAGLFAPLIIVFLVEKLNLNYVFSAPICRLATDAYKKLYRPAT